MDESGGFHYPSYSAVGVVMSDNGAVVGGTLYRIGDILVKRNGVMMVPKVAHI